jgi:hypothetical protein
MTSACRRRTLMYHRFTQGEFWILSSAVQTKYPIACLIEADLEAHYNRRSHGLDVSEVVDTLDVLFTEGLLEVERWSPRVNDFVRSTLPRDQILPALHWKPDRLDYALTAEGGAAWESFARPNWEAFISHERDQDDTSMWVVACTDRRRLAQYLWANSLHERNPAIGAAEIEAVAEWPATYWKTLPHGFRARYPANDDGPEMIQDPEVSMRHWLIFLGMCAMRDVWCRMAR